MIEKIEHYLLNRTQPAFDDKESLTAVDLVGKNTAKVNEIVDLVNGFTKEMKDYINEFTESTNKDYDAFKVSINQKIIDFIEVIDLKIAGQDKDIEEFIEESTNNYNTFTEGVINHLSEQDKEIEESIIYIKENLGQYLIDNVESVLKEKIEKGELDQAVIDALGDIQTQINGITGVLDSKVNVTDVYAKEELYTKSEVYAKGEVYTKSEVDNLIDGIEIPEGGSTGDGSSPRILELVVYSEDGTSATVTDENKESMSRLINEANTKNLSNFMVYAFHINSDGTTIKNKIYHPDTPFTNTATSYYFFEMSTGISGDMIGSYIKIEGTWTDGVFTCSTFSYSNGDYLYNNYLPLTSVSKKEINYDIRSSKATSPANSQSLVNREYVTGNFVKTTDYTTKMTEIDSSITALNEKAHNLLSGTNDPTTDLGEDGDIYFQYSGY